MTQPRRRIVRRALWGAIAAIGAAGVLGGLVIASSLVNDGDTGQASPSPSMAPSASASSSATPERSPSSTSSPQSSTPSPDASASGPHIVMREGTDDTIEFLVGFGRGTAGRVAAVNVSNYASVPATAPSDGSAAIYLEADDGSWQLVDTGTTFRGVRLTSLMNPTGGPLVLYGSRTDADRDREITGAWTSEDGLTWTQADIDPVDGVMAEGPLGYVQARSARSESSAPTIEVYRSDDAASWELVYTTPAGVSAVVTAAGAGPEGFVVTARRIPDEAPLILASDDGRAWFEAPDQPAFTEGDVAMQVAPIGPDWVAAGWRSGSETGRGIDLWTSADGSAWEIAGSIEPDEELKGMGTRVMYPSHFISQDGGGYLFLSGALAAEGSETRPIGVWTSTDGATWETLDLEGQAEVRVVEGVECCIWLGGRLGSDDGEAVIWRWDPSAD